MIISNGKMEIEKMIPGLAVYVVRHILIPLRYSGSNVRDVMLGITLLRNVLASMPMLPRVWMSGVVGHVILQLKEWDYKLDCDGGEELDRSIWYYTY